MEPMLVYIVQTVVCSGVLLLLYKALVDRQLPCGVCRVYLIVSMIVGAVIPVLNIPVYAPEVVYYTAMPITDTSVPGVAVETQSHMNIVLLIYLGIAVLGLTLVLFNIIRIYAMRRGARVTLGKEYTLYESERIKSPFSFFKNIFICAELSPHELSQVVAHELSHIRHRHSAELLVAEMFKVLLWFNPFVWIMRRLLVEVHEFQADRDVLQKGYDIDDYRTLIFKQLFGCNPDMTSGLNHSLTKKRFIMMTKQNRSRYTVLKLSAALPIIAGLMMLFSFTRQETVYIEKDPQPSKQDVTKNTVSDTLNFTKSKTLRIRGLKGSEMNPVVIVDGKLFTCQLDSLSPDMIESITVLKDSASKAKYGYAGSPGIVIVTTKGHALISTKATAQTEVGDIDEVKIKLSKAAEIQLMDSTVMHISETAVTNEVMIVGVRHEVSETTTSDDAPFVIVEKMPKFEGRDLSAFGQWVSKNIKYPTQAIEQGIEGRVIMSFVVEADGSVTNATAISGPKELVQEAARVILSSPRWTPGEMRGKKVRVKSTLPIDFKIPEQTKKK